MEPRGINTAYVTCSATLRYGSLRQMNTYEKLRRTHFKNVYH